MIVSHKYKFIFFETPKTGSCSIHESFSNLHEEQELGEYFWSDRFNRHLDRHITPRDLSKLPIFDKIKDYFKFCFVRNPYDHYYSSGQFECSQKKHDTIIEDSKHYPASVLETDDYKYMLNMYKKYNDPEDVTRFYFRKWIAGEKFIFNFCDWTHLHGHQFVDFIGHTETLDQDLSIVIDKLNLDTSELNELQIINSVTGNKQSNEYKYVDGYYDVFCLDWVNDSYGKYSRDYWGYESSYSCFKNYNYRQLTAENYIEECKQPPLLNDDPILKQESKKVFIEVDKNNNAIARSFDNENYNQAINLTKEQPVNSSNIELLSLLYRLTDRYPEEHKLVEFMTSTYDCSNYFKDRDVWWKKSMHEKCEPRPKTIFQESEFSIDMDILNSLCFVTIGDENVFPDMVQSIESVKALDRYKDVPYYVLITPGNRLTVEQRKYLVSHGVTDILDIDIAKYIGQENANRLLQVHGLHKANVSVPYINQIITGHEHIIYIETDVWQCNSTSLDKMLNQLSERDFTKATPSHMGFIGFKHDSKMIQHWVSHCKSTYDLRFKSDKRQNIWSLYFNDERYKLPDGLKPLNSDDKLHNVQMYEESIINHLQGREWGWNNCTVHMRKFNSIDDFKCYERSPMLNNENIMVNESGVPINSIHTTKCVYHIEQRDGVWFNNIKYNLYHKNLKEIYYLPVERYDSSNLKRWILKERIKLTGGYILSTLDKNNTVNPTNMIGVKYRVLPWADKKYIKECIDNLLRGDK